MADNPPKKNPMTNDDAKRIGDSDCKDEGFKERAKAAAKRNEEQKKK